MQPRSKSTKPKKKVLNKLHEQLNHVIDRVKHINRKLQIRQARAEARNCRRRARRALLRELRKDGLLSSEPKKTKKSETKEQCFPKKEANDADDYFVVIIGDEEKRKRKQDLFIKQDPDNAADSGVLNLIETVKMHGEVLPIEFDLDVKVEPVDESDVKNKSHINDKDSEDNNNVSEDLKYVSENDNNVFEDENLSEDNHFLEKVEKAVGKAKVGKGKVGKAKVGKAKVGKAKGGKAKVGKAKVGKAKGGKANGKKKLQSSSKRQKQRSYIDDDDNNVSEDDNFSENIEKPEGKKQPRRSIKRDMQQSYIESLREEYPELREDKSLLIDTVCEIMRSVKPPPPPQDYFIMNDAMFECTFCGVQSRTVPAAARHYQHKHGTRYLVCFACGMDFVSTTDLYRHEKRCSAPDAIIVLKARALFLGPKGRSRPYLKKYDFRMSNLDVKRVRRRYIKPLGKYKYQCNQCPAVFSMNVSLQSHLHLHSGVRPYQCMYCPAAYTSKVSFRNHTQTHLNLEYICDYCNRSFKMKKTLVAHMNVHNPQSRFACEFCGKQYAQKTSLTLHINKVHLWLPPSFACHFCEKRYRKNSTLKVHVRRDHGSTLITRDTFLKKLPKLSEEELNEAKLIFNSDLNYISDTILTPEVNHLEDQPEEKVKPKPKKKRERKQRKNKMNRKKDDKLIDQNGDLVSRRKIIKQEKLVKEADDKIINQNAELVSRKEIEEQEQLLEMEDDKIINQNGDLVSRREIEEQEMSSEIDDEKIINQNGDLVSRREIEEQEALSEIDDEKIINQNGDLVSRKEIEEQEKLMEVDDDKIINQNGDLVSRREIEMNEESNDWKVRQEVNEPRGDADPDSILKNLCKEIVVKKISAKKEKTKKTVKNERDTVKYFAIQLMDDSMATVGAGLKRQRKTATEKPKKIFLTNQHVHGNKPKKV